MIENGALAPFFSQSNFFSFFWGVETLCVGCNCGGPLFDVLQSACSYNTAIQQKMRPQRHKRKRSPRSEHSLTGYLHAGWAGGKGGPTDPPSRSKHKGFQKISRKKKTRVPGVRESVRAEPAGRGHSGRTPGAPKTHKVRKHKTGEKSEEPETLKNSLPRPEESLPPGLQNQP